MPENKVPTPSQARRRRARRLQLIRRRTAATALATFVLAFGAISATGSMGATNKAPSAQHRKPAKSSASTDSTTGSSTTGDTATQDQSTSTSTSTDSQSSPAPVTT